jgi:tRNA-specific 2-thiouridylase
LAQAAAPHPGPILDTAGRVLGQHEGIANYTVGQRRGLRLAAGRPLYVTRISPRDNSVTLGTRDEASRRSVSASGLNVLLPDRLRPGERLLGKLRSLSDPAPCTVAAAEPGTLAVEFDVPQFAPTPGQHLVLYDAEGRVVAGGVMDDAADGPSRQAATKEDSGQ